MPTDKGTCKTCYYSSHPDTGHLRCRRYPPENKWMRSDNLKLAEVVTITYLAVSETDWCGEYLSREEMK